MRGRMCRRRRQAARFSPAVRLVCMQLVGTPTRSAPRTRDGLHRVEHLSSICPSWTLAAVSSMARADRCHRSAGDALLPGRPRSQGLGPLHGPNTGTNDASSAARFRLMRPHRPFLVQVGQNEKPDARQRPSRSRRQQVMPEPQPSSRGRSSTGFRS